MLIMWGIVTIGILAAAYLSVEIICLTTELAALLNDPVNSEDFFKYRIEKDAEDLGMVVDNDDDGTPPSLKRRRETTAFASGLALSRQPVVCHGRKSNRV
jgi:hypothetical protein